MKEARRGEATRRRSEVESDVDMCLSNISLVLKIKKKKGYKRVLVGLGFCYVHKRKKGVL
jgi:hypothetical protein